MTKEMLNQMEQFEIFVEKMEEFVNNIQYADNPRSVFDLRMPDINGFLNNYYAIPTTIKDYAEIWQDINYIRDNITDYYRKCVGNCIFLDVYWNDSEANYADYTGETFWIDFEENGKWYIHT